jgi:hypothetical protein
MSRLSEGTKKEIKNIIKSYCEGVNHLEFNLSDLDQMVEEIINVSEIKSNAEDALNWSWRNGDDMGK